MVKTCTVVVMGLEHEMKKACKKLTSMLMTLEMFRFRELPATYWTCFQHHNYALLHWSIPMQFHEGLQALAFIGFLLTVEGSGRRPQLPRTALIKSYW